MSGRNASSSVFWMGFSNQFQSLSPVGKYRADCIYVEGDDEDI